MDFLRSLFTSILAELVIDPVNRFIADHVNRRKPGDPHPVAVYSGWLGCTFCVVVSVFFVPLLLLIIWFVATARPLEQAVMVVPLCGGIAIWMCLTTFDTFVRRIEWTETEVRFRKWNSDRTVAWDEIVGLEEKWHPPHTRIAFRDGSGFGITETMRGSRYFMALVERRLDPDGPEGGKRRRRRQRGKKR